jgi:1,2-phenylacetyl-CoA epoxidase catalytic subunit
MTEAIPVLIGGILGFVGAFLVSRYERSKAAGDAKQRVLARYQAQAAIVVARLRELPTARSGALARLIDRIQGEQVVWAKTQRGMTETLGPGWREPMETLMVIGAELRLLKLNGQMLKAMDRAEEYIERLSRDRTDELRAEWAEVHGELDRAVRAERD